VDYARIVTDPAARSAGFETAGLEHRSLELKGKTAKTGVFVATVRPA